MCHLWQLEIYRKLAKLNKCLRNVFKIILRMQAGKELGYHVFIPWWIQGGGGT